MPGLLSFFICGSGGKRSKKKKRTNQREGMQGADVSFKRNFQYRGMESAVMKTVLSDNSRLLLENENLRKEVEYFRASLVINPSQEEELRRNLSTPWNLSENELGEGASENPSPQARNDSQPLLSSELTTAATAYVMDEVGTETLSNMAGGEEERESADGKAKVDVEDSAVEGTCPKGIASLSPDEDCSAPHQETEQPGKNGQLESGVDSSEQVLLCLPEKLTSMFREDLKIVEDHFGEKFRDLRGKISKHGKKTALMLKKEAADLSAGQRKLLDLAQSTHAGLTALGEALKSPQTPPDPQACKLPPHLTALALDIQDKFVTTTAVKEFFRCLGMNPGNVEELAAHAHSGPSGSRDLFWTMLVAHNGDLSQEGQAVNLADMLEACQTLDISTWECTVMPRGHRRVLERKLVELVRTLRVDMLLPHLTSAGLMTSPGIKDYVTEGTTEQQVMKLLDVLPLGGENALEQLVVALRQTGQEHVAQIILGELDHSGVELRTSPRRESNSSRQRTLPPHHGNDVKGEDDAHSDLLDKFQGVGDLLSAFSIIVTTLADIKSSVKHLESKMK